MYQLQYEPAPHSNQSFGQRWVIVGVGGNFCKKCFSIYLVIVSDFVQLKLGKIIDSIVKLQWMF